MRKEEDDDGINEVELRRVRVLRICRPLHHIQVYMGEGKGGVSATTPRTCEARDRASAITLYVIYDSNAKFRESLRSIAKQSVAK